MWNRQTLFAGFCAALAVLCLWGQAAAESVSVVGQQSGRLDLETNTFVVEGGVVVEQGDRRMEGDRLTWDLNAQELILEGDVSLVYEDHQLWGQRLIYNVETESGTFSDMRSTLLPDFAASPIFIYGDTVAVDGDSYIMQQARATTCDLDKPHYYVAVRELEVRPGDRLIIRGVTFYEGPIPLFYWPYMVIPLRDILDHSVFSLPSIGYGTEEGWYIKNSFSYFFSERSYGQLFYDYYTRWGSGFGLRHAYDLGALGSGSVYGYTIPTAPDELQRFRWQHASSGSRLRWDALHEQEWRILSQQESISVRSQANVHYHTDRTQVSGRWLYNQDAEDSVLTRWNAEGRWEQILTDNLRLSLSGSTAYRKGVTVERMVNRAAVLNYQRLDHLLRLTLQERYNPDLLDEDERPNWSSINRVPELLWQWRNPKLGALSIPGRWELGVGRFREFPRVIERTRWAASLDLAAQRLQLSDALSVVYRGTGFARFYGESEFHGAVSSRVNLHYRPTTQLTLSGSYVRQDAYGETPFNFDRLRDQHSVSAQLAWAPRPWHLSLQSSYNLITERYSDLVGQIRVNTGPWRLSLYGSYDLNTQTGRSIVPLVSYTSPGDTAVQLGGRYSVNNQNWERIDGKLVLPIGDDWRVSYEAVYRPQSQDFAAGSLGVTRDMHCRSVSFRYEQVRQTFWFEYRIHAFPQMPIAFGTDEGTTLFDLRSVQDILGIEDEAR